MAREMKDSGIEWIGEVPTEWTICHFRNIVNIYNGNSIKDDEKKNYEDYREAIPYIATKDIDATFQTIDYANGMYVKLNDSSFKRAPKNSVLLCIEGGSAGKKIAFTNQEVCFINKLCCFHSQSTINKYVYYYMCSHAFTCEFNSHISGLIGGVSISEIKGFSITLPPLPEQEKIAAHLDSECAKIDDVITKTKATIEEYKKLKQSVITEAVTKGIRPDREMKDSGIEWIGEIPREWGFVKITRILDYNTIYPIGDGDHGLVKPTDYQDSGIPYIRVQNLGWGTELLLENIVYISEQTNGKIKNSTLRTNDVLIAKTGATIGKTGIIPSSMPIANTTSHIGKITVDSKYNARFIFYALSSYVGYRQLWEFALLKTTRPELAIDEIKTIRITLPHTIDEQKEIVSYLDQKCSEIENLIAKKEQIVSELESYKKSLIYEYVTGKKEVV